MMSQEMLRLHKHQGNKITNCLLNTCNLKHKIQKKSTSAICTVFVIDNSKLTFSKLNLRSNQMAWEVKYALMFY